MIDLSRSQTRLRILLLTGIIIGLVALTGWYALTNEPAAIAGSVSSRAADPDGGATSQLDPSSTTQIFSVGTNARPATARVHWTVRDPLPTTPGRSLMCALAGELIIPRSLPVEQVVVSASVGNRTCLQVVLRRGVGGGIIYDELTLTRGHRTKQITTPSVSVDAANYAQRFTYRSSELFSVAVEPAGTGVAFRASAKTGLLSTTTAEDELSLALDHGRVLRTTSSLSLPITVSKRGNWGRNNGALSVKLRKPDGTVASDWQRPISVGTGRTIHQAEMHLPEPGLYLVSATFQGDANEPALMRTVVVPPSRPGPFLIAAGALVAAVAISISLRPRNAPRNKGKVIMVAALVGLFAFASYTALTDTAAVSAAGERRIPTAVAPQQLPKPLPNTPEGAADIVVSTPTLRQLLRDDAFTVSRMPLQLSTLSGSTVPWRVRVVSLSAGEQTRPVDLQVDLDKRTGAVLNIAEFGMDS